jgi:hypothetical protein
VSIQICLTAGSLVIGIRILFTLNKLTCSSYIRQLMLIAQVIDDHKNDAWGTLYSYTAGAILTYAVAVNPGKDVSPNFIFSAYLF